jgi:hypothetical protein
MFHDYLPSGHVFGRLADMGQSRTPTSNKIIMGGVQMSARPRITLCG